MPESRKELGKNVRMKCNDEAGKKVFKKSEKELVR